MPRLRYLVGAEVSFALLMIVFAWTSHTLSQLPPVMSWGLFQVYYYSTGLAIVGFHGPIGLYFAWVDVSAIFLFGIFCLCVSRAASRLATLRLALVTLAILPTEVFLFDKSELFIQVSSVQELWGIAPWFTNADLLAFTLAASAFLAFVPRLRAAGRK